MTEALFALPLWLLAFVLTTWLSAVGLVGLWVVRRWVLPRFRLTYPDAYIGAAVVQSCMLLYSLIAALTAVGVWQRHSEVGDIVSNEATAITNLWRDVGGYPQAERDQMREVLRGYTQQIIHEAWPQQERGEVPRAGVEWMDRFQSVLFAVEPSTEGQKILHGETLGAFNELVQMRRHRLDSISGGLPRVLWYVLLPGAMGAMIIFLFFHVESVAYHALLLVALAAFLSMVLFVIIGMDRPFSGDMRITADSYQLIYDHHMR